MLILDLSEYPLILNRIKLGQNIAKQIQKYINKERKGQAYMSQQFRKNIPPQLYGKHFSLITFKTTFGNCVFKALCNRKWKRVDPQSNDFNLQWCEKQRVNDVFVNGLSGNQKVNHFRLYTQLCRKDMLMKNVRKHKRQLAKEKKLVEKEWNFLPLTFFLPSEYIMFAEEFKRQGGLWIMKPTARCQGSGIFLVDKLVQVAPYRFKKSLNQQSQPPSKPPSNQRPLPQQKNKTLRQQPQPAKNQPQSQQNSSQQQQPQQSDKQQQQVQAKQQSKQNQNWIIQQYIAKPLLFGRKKFDLRIYVLCTNYSQLTVWLYREGFARFTHQPYDTDDIMNLGGHLTNVEIQKHTQGYDQIRGGKWMISKFKHYLMSSYGIKRTDQCFTQIQNIIIHSLQAVQKHIVVSKNSFQLYGYDVMIDSGLKPWLIEVNGGPSMTANTDFDCRLKCGLIDDVLTIVNLEGIVTGEEMTVGAFDLIVSKGVNVRKSPYSQTQTNLGWKTDRKANYKHLLKEFFIRKQKQKALIQQKSTHPTRKSPQYPQPTKPSTQQQPPARNTKQLPKFYYKQKPTDQIDDSIKSNLKKQLNHLNERNENLVAIEEIEENEEGLTGEELEIFYRRQWEVNYHRFMPLRASKLIRTL